MLSLRKNSVRISVELQISLTKIVRSFTQSLHANVPFNITRPPPSKSIHDSYQFSLLINNISYVNCRTVYNLIHLHTKCHVPSSKGSLVIAVKLKAKCKYFGSVTMLLFNRSQQINGTKPSYF
jgi:hypothetical protein